MARAAISILSHLYLLRLRLSGGTVTVTAPNGLSVGTVVVGSGFATLDRFEWAESNRFDGDPNPIYRGYYSFEWDGHRGHVFNHARLSHILKTDYRSDDCYGRHRAVDSRVA